MNLTDTELTDFTADSCGGADAHRRPITDINGWLEGLEYDVRPALRALGELLIGATERETTETADRFTARCLDVADCGNLLDEERELNPVSGFTTALALAEWIDRYTPVCEIGPGEYANPPMWDADRDRRAALPPSALSACAFPCRNTARQHRIRHPNRDTRIDDAPHHQHSTVVMHFDVDKRAGSLHLGPVLTEAERQYLSCDATYEVWFERAGQVIGAGRSTRQINRRLRRALEHRDRTCVVPGCGASRGLHAHRIVLVRREARDFRSEVKDLRSLAVTAAGES